jgi:hypothetical protein
MSSQSAQLLQLLGATASPQVNPGSALPRPGIGSLDFASLLQSAQAGKIASGRAVTLGKNSGVTLNDEQLGRLSAVADRAEAMGASNALVLIDGQAVTLNVASREITGQVDAQSGSLLGGVDAVLGAPPAAGATATAPAAPSLTSGGVLPLPTSGSAGASSSLLRILSAASR